MPLVESLAALPKSASFRCPVRSEERSYSTPIITSSTTDEDVLWLDVPVDEPQLVEVMDAEGHLGHIKPDRCLVQAGVEGEV